MVGGRLASGQRARRRPVRRAARRGVRVRDRGRAGRRRAPPVAVLSFADEEGARFNTPDVREQGAGRAARSAGRARPPRRRRRVVARRDARRRGRSGRDRRRARLADRLAGFIEIHIDQTTELARAGEPVGVVSSLAARTRLEVLLRGRADHAGTTPRAERRDALAAAARLIVGAEDLRSRDDPVRSRSLHRESCQAQRADDDRRGGAAVDRRAGARASGRSTRGGRGWTSWRRAGGAVRGRDRGGRGLADRSRASSRPSCGQRSLALARTSLGHAVPELVCFAGHDAGVLAERVPAAMLFVRNPTGISHSPEEPVDARRRGDRRAGRRARAGALS